MILLDTNVLSELARPDPHPDVAAWARRTPTGRLYTTSITEAELLYGVALLNPGRRRDDVTAAILRVLRSVIGGRVLPFDREAAKVYAEIAASRRRAGRSVATFDLQIAAIAQARRAEAVATRNVDDFEIAGMNVVNPWTTGS